MSTTTLSVPQIIAARRDALLERWRRNPLQQVLAEGHGALGRLVWIDDGAVAQVSKMPRRNQQKVAIAGADAPNKHDASVWVQASYSSYRSAYGAFLASVYGVNRATVTAALGPYDVDHLLNRARPQVQSSMIRLEAIDMAANRSWGSLFEKVASNPDFYANQARQRRTMSWVIAAKLGGQMAPSGPSDTAGIDRLANWFATKGFDRNEARDGLASMLGFAYSL